MVPFLVLVIHQKFILRRTFGGSDVGHIICHDSASRISTAGRDVEESHVPMLVSDSEDRD